ncbi:MULTISPECIES: glycosyltransferase family 2 protein [Providencia]|uniref:WbcL protein n=1 Tax=Providencia alcalifaciens TaxID=126385 RepID=A0A346CL69_9GAMM|nr:MULTISPECIES: glycosyltransferase family 2 protein [Providencia]AXL96343.1 WbcL protein [Providencia alcalifaciens]EUD07047.1 glycosyltransferase, group 2 family protein [Providencia alcalifaciens R90-1475]MTC41880.1 glycosyltransferase [Providencia sp. wls1921]
MINFTIFTPTYNRADELKRCYESLLNQNFHNFEWIIIDDGSTDNTSNIVESFKINATFNIKYIYQENSGKQAAWNRAIDLASYDYFLGLDSDDMLYPNSLLALSKKIDAFEDDEIIGIRALSISSDTKKLTNYFLLDTEAKASWFDEFKSGKHGERIDLFKTKLIQQFKYPVKKNTKFIPEIWLYSNISKSYKFKYLPIIVRVFFDDNPNNRLSRTSLIEHATGHFIARKSLLENTPLTVWLSRPIDLLKSAIRLHQTIRILNIKRIEFSNRAFLLNIITLPAITLNKIGLKK